MACRHIHRISRTRPVGYRLDRRKAEILQADFLVKEEIRDRKRAEQAARMAEARFSTVIRLSPDAMSISCGVEGRILDVNDRWEELFGYKRAEVLGRTVGELGLYSSEEDYIAIVERHRAFGCIRELEIGVRGKSGWDRRAILFGQGIAMGGAACFITVIRDIDRQSLAECEAQRLRAQLAQLARVALLGNFPSLLPMRSINLLPPSSPMRRPLCDSWPGILSICARSGTFFETSWTTTSAQGSGSDTQAACAVHEGRAKTAAAGP